jgi:hypothetical protein
MSHDSEKIRERTAMLKGGSAIEYLLRQCYLMELEIERLNEGVTIDDKDREIAAVRVREGRLYAKVAELEASLELKMAHELEVYGWAVREEHVTPDCYVIGREAEVLGAYGTKEEAAKFVVEDYWCHPAKFIGGTT